MRYIKRVLASILTVVLVCGLFPAFVSADPTLVYITVDSYSSGTVNFHWNSLPGTNSVVITYHTPDANNDPVMHAVTLDQTTNTASVSGLKNDYIYDISVKIFSAAGGGGEQIGEGFFYYLPKMSFYSTALNQTYEDIDGGGRETGHKPRLNLKWAMPRVYNGSSFVYANSALLQMQNTLNSVYNDGRQISSLDFRINISSELSLLNGGSAQSAVLVNSGAGGYTASISGSSSITADVYGLDANGYMNFNLIGRRDESSPVPGDADKANYKVPEDPVGIEDYMLPDGDILPGTVYYMNVKPIFKNAAGTPVNALTAGVQADQNGSMLSGIVPYAYTPVMFQLTKDSANNIYVKIFKINQGSLDLPRLYYEVQTSDDPSIPGDWTVKKTMDDTYFSGDFAITVLTGVNPNNEMYYKIVVRSDSVDARLESPKMPYILADDTSRPPVPTGIAVIKRELAVGDVNGETRRTTDVTISWDKPGNWDEIKANTVASEDIVFHIMLSTNQTDLDVEPAPELVAEGESYGSFPVKYRLVKYVSAKNVVENGSRLEYKIEGFELFKGEYYVGGDPAVINVADIPNDENYPSFLLPNKVYYMQMYTTLGEDRGSQDAEDMSGFSLVTSFTALSAIQCDVPLASGLEATANGVDETRDPVTGEVTSISNYIQLSFEKVNINWNYYVPYPEEIGYTINHNIFYDLYASTSTQADSFILLGSTDTSIDPGDVLFTDNGSQSAYIRAEIRNFTPGNQAYDMFGSKLRPNTTYYFYIKTRLVIEKVDTGDNVVDSTELESIPTAILPVTTVKGSVGDPDDSARRPLAPVDFGIAADADGNPLVTGTSAVFNWSKQETDIKYEIICTSERVSPDAPMSTYEDDPVYQSYIYEFDDIDSSQDERVYLDPDADPPHAPGKFTYDSLTKLFTYKINTWLFPNKLYYFSIRAVNKSNGSESVWVSIPVTTYLIDGPSMISAVNDYQLAFFWSDDSLNTMPEDCHIYLKGPKDTDYKLLTRSQSTVVKDSDGSTFYARITGLENDTSYSVKVYKGSNNETLVFQDNSMNTRDGYHEIEVMWRGIPVDDYSRYEIAIMAADDSEYTTLLDYDLEQYVDKNGRSLPYYVEETAQTVSKDFVYYHAKIKKAEVVLSGGSSVHQQLRSNTKYYVKVRAVKVDPSDDALISYSKYAGPVDTRTEFNQEDYDSEDQQEKSEAVFLDKIKELERGLFWRVAINDSSANRILLKSDRVINSIQNSGNSPVTIDISTLSLNIDSDVIYMPLSVAKALNTENKGLVIKTSDSEFAFKPRTLDVQSITAITTVQGKAGVSDLLLKLTITHTGSAVTGLPARTGLVSKVNDVEIQALGISKTDSELKELFYDKLYNSDTGLVNEKLNILLSHSYGGNTESSQALEQYTNELIKLIERDLSIYISTIIETERVSGAAEELTSFNDPLTVKIYYSNNKKGLKQPYVYYDGASSWQKITVNTDRSNSVIFNAAKTGKYAILLSQASINDVPDSHWAKSYIDKFLSKYDLSDVFTGISTAFAPENRVSGKEVILLYEKVTDRSSENAGLDIKQKAGKLGLDSIINLNSIMRDINRQETAAVIIKIYSVKTGVDAESLQPKAGIYLKDEADVSDKFYKPVLLVLDLNILEKKEDGKFNPKSPVTRAEMIAALVKLLELTGEM